MIQTRRMALGGLAVLTALLLQACGGGTTSSSDPKVRLINATNSYAGLDLLVDLSTKSSSVARDAAGDYVSIGDGSVALQVNSAGGSSALLSTSTTLSKDGYYSFLAYELNGSVKLASLTETTTTPTSGTAQWRVLNLATSAGALDVYLTDTSTDLSTVGSATFTLASSTSATTSSLTTVAPGTYRLRVTGSGNRSDIRLDLPSVTISNQQVVNMLLTPASGASLLNGAWVPEKATGTLVRNAQARVRLVAAVSGSPTVAASAGGTVISAGSVAPSVGDYVIVPAGSLTASVGGLALDTSALSLTAGSDASLLVHGAPGTATAKLLVDNNFAPTSSTNVKMRLLNGLTGTSTGLILTTDFAVMADNLLPGQVSTSALATASTSMRVEVTSAVTQQSLYLQSALNLSGGSVYTLFMLGESTSPTGVLRKDH